MNPKKIEEFKKTVWDFYKRHGRHDMLWRQTTDPYSILVSEIMLQQTQVDRVTDKYKEFITQFPTIKELAEASLGEVLIVWSGLGYNRRAKYLKLTAEKIAHKYNNIVPTNKEALIELPGIGEATAAALLTYAYKKPMPYIETNVRTVFIHHFFPNKKSVTDKELFPFVEASLDKKNPREWYWAIMDYGTHLKKIHGNISQKSKQYIKQSKFQGSRRQKRSAIIKKLIKSKQLNKQELNKTMKIPSLLLTELLDELKKEGLIKESKSFYSLP